MKKATASEIAAIAGGRVVGDGDTVVTGVSGVREASAGDLAFVADPAYVPYAARTAASVLLVREPLETPAAAQVVVDDPADALERLAAHFLPAASHPTGIAPTAHVEEGARLGEGVAVGAFAYVADSAVLEDGVVVYPHAYVGPDCVVGAGTVLYPRAVLYHGTKIGKRCIVHAGAVLGADGFGFAFAGGEHRKIPQLGTVEVGDDVEIGANSTIDRARLGKTRIGSGTKIDNLVQIGHNAQIGNHCVLCGMVGVAGSARVGNYVTLAAGSGVAGHLELGDGVTVAGLAGVTKSIEAGRTVSGFPAVDHTVERRIKASVRRLPEALRTVRALEQRIAALETRLHGRQSEDDR